MRNAHGRNVNMQRKLTNRKMRNSHCRTWNMERKPKNEENEKLTWQDMKYGEKH